MDAPARSPRGSFAFRLTAGVLFASLTLLAGCDKSPTGRKRVTLVPDAQMSQMGANAFAEMLQTQPVSRDSRVTGYVGCVARALVDALPPPRGEWSVAVFEDPTPNAFALPGGKIGVNTGMLKVARTPAQLAAVIGHEIGHVLADHSNERLTQELAVKSGLMLVDLLAETPGSLEHEVLRKALGVGANYGLLLPYNRAHESEADEIGHNLMARAGFDPRASVTLWQNMAAVGNAQPLEFLSTHPSHDSRIDDLAQRMEVALALYKQARAEERHPSCRPPGSPQ